MGRPRDPELAGLYQAMERYIDGDARAYARVHATLGRRLRGFLLRILSDREIVEDLLQVTFLKAHLARDRFTLQGGDPDGAVQAWYFAIARNAAMDHLRREYRKSRREVKHGAPDGDDLDPMAKIADQGPTVEELGLDRERELEIVERVQAAIARLPEGQREVVELHKLQGMSMAEVAERLDLREGAVRVRAHRAYKALARWLVPSIFAIFWSAP
ncbi:MAG: RNA polymerase sigma factor [Myxococcales bacterium]|nr:RNA polymerase sigma factor [Myxococcales bacterium]MCB9702746.1 RNA polymerase sigma factor [Myxococcales bacterium]